jgi:methionine-rich copper-binding protein CopC
MKRIGLVVASFLLIWASAPSAQAHTELVSSSPAADAQVAAPSAISLTFTEAPILEGSSIVLSDATGMQYSTGQLTLEGSTLTGDWPADLPVGYTKVSWRAVADDGHVVTGDYSFYYSAAAAEQSVITDASATPEAVAYSEAAPKSSARAGVAVGAGIGALLALATFFILRSRRNK